MSQLKKLLVGCCAIAASAVAMPAQASTYSDAVTGDGALGYWRMEETSGTNAVNDGSLGATHDATYLGGFTQGVLGAVEQPSGNKAVLLNGTSGYLAVNSAIAASGFGADGDYTVELWFNTTGLNASDDLIAMTDTSTNQHGVLLETSGSAGNLRYLHRSPSGSGGGQNINPTNNEYTASTWHYLTVVNDNSAMKLYLDGNLDSVTNTSSGDLTFDLNMVMGRLGSAFSDRYFAGALDEVAIYDDALSQTQILHHFEASGRYNGLVRNDTPTLYYRFEETSGTQVNDSSGMDTQDGIYNGGVALGEAFAMHSMRDNKAANFDGVNDYVSQLDAVTAAEFGGGGSYSVELWFKADQLGLMDLVSLTNAGGNEGHGVLLELQTNGLIRFLHRSPSGGSGGTSLVTSQSYDIDAWHHLVAVNDNGTMRLYLDGVLDVTTAFDASLLNFNLDLTVGRLKFDNAARHFNGSMDELALYNYALSAEQVRLHFTSAIPEPATASLGLISLAMLALHRRRRWA